MSISDNELTIIIRKRGDRVMKKLPPVGVVRVVVSKSNGIINMKSKETGRTITIRNAETSFVSFIKHYYGTGSYTILCRVGKQKGFRRFWNGLIMEDKYVRTPPSADLGFIDSLFSRYIKANRPTIWYSLI
jgi:hypothetical protein